MTPRVLVFLSLLLNPVGFHGVSGYVLDPKGCFLTGAEVTLSSADTPRIARDRNDRPCLGCSGYLTATTDSAGHFAFMLADHPLTQVTISADAWGYHSVVADTTAESDTILLVSLTLSYNPDEGSSPASGKNQLGGPTAESVCR